MAKAFTISSGLNGLPAEGRGALAAATLVTATAANAQPVAPQPLLSTTLQGGDGDDVLATAQLAVAETLFGLGGNDTLSVQPGGWAADTLFGGDGDDRLYGGSTPGDVGKAWLYGGDGNDLIVGGSWSYGGAGDDRFELQGDSGMILGGAAVHAHGDAGNDLFIVGNGGVRVWGFADEDRLEMRVGGLDDILQTDFYGGDGDDFVEIIEDEEVWGEQRGQIAMSGGAGNDVFAHHGSLLSVAFFGGAGDDRLSAGGESQLSGEGGNDLLTGGDGGQQLWGGAGNDQLYGGSGRDRLSGGQGGDLLYGGAGADVFVADASTDRTGRADRVMDLDVAAGDRINLTQLLGNMSGVDLIAEGFVRATAVTIDGVSYAAVQVDRDGAAGKGDFQQALLVRTDDPLALNEQEFWTFG